MNRGHSDRASTPLPLRPLVDEVLRALDEAHRAQRGPRDSIRPSDVPGKRDGAMGSKASAIRIGQDPGPLTTNRRYASRPWSFRIATTRSRGSAGVR